MTAPVLADVLGPRARRRVLVLSVVAGVAVAVVLGLAVKRLADRDQLAEQLWRPLTDDAVLRFLWGGLANTLRAALVAMALALVAGAFLALGRLSRTGPVRWLTGAWVEFFRAVPLLLLILFSGLGLPKYGVDLDVFWYLVLALVAYNSAVLAEIFRAGILSLDRGQFEASYAVGLSYWETMLSVIVPQAVRRMVPAVVSQLVTLLKDTSLGYVITYEELLRRGRITGEFYRNPLQALVLVAVVYVVVNFVLSVTARRLEDRQRRRYRAGEIRVAGVEELA
ncbi:MAG TPA: amino acid ABC transporter permease [Acidimicrobiales bacterium]|nr:amino acid ABC transporter permease [Acidimicrobiales bacterium]